MVLIMENGITDLILPAGVSAGVAGLTAIIILLLGRHSDRKWEEYKRKEDRYNALLNSLKGFYLDANPATASEDKEEFIRQLDMCWLYCPDAVVKAAYAFLELVKVGAKSTDEQKEQALGKFIALIRNDLFGKHFGVLRKTSLEASDHRLYTST